jgi:predicted nucleic acid-binding protein
VRVRLVDTGPLVAALNRRDNFHGWAREALETIRPPLLTCEAVLSEAAYLLRDVTHGPAALLELVMRGLVRSPFRLEAEAAAVRQLLVRYASTRMDLADACLVRMAEVHADCELLTLDREFRDVYRRRGRQAIPTLMPPRSGMRQGR